MPDNYSYAFEPRPVCNMCGANASGARVLGRRLNSSQGLRPVRRRGVSTTIVRCSTCGLVYADPQPIPRDFDQHYGTPPEKYWSPEYFEDHPEYFYEQIDTFFRLWQGSGQPVALDVGAGLGKGMRSLMRRGFDTYGLEASSSFVDAAVERGSIDRDRLRCALVEDAEYPGASFDFISFSAVLEHLYDPAGALERVVEWCAPGGVIQVEVPSSRWLVNRLANVAYRIQGLDYCANISPMSVPYHLYEFTLDSFRRHGERTGYRVVTCKRYVGPTYLPKPVGAIAERVMEATGSGMQLEVWLQPI